MNSNLIDWTQERIAEAMRNVVLLGKVRFDSQLDAGPPVHTIFTAPPGKRAIVEFVVFCENTVSLVGMTDVNLGGGADAASPAWNDAEDLSTITFVDASKIVWSDRNFVTPIDGDDATPANRNFGIEVVAGSTAAGFVTVMAFGFLIDS